MLLLPALLSPFQVVVAILDSHRAGVSTVSLMACSIMTRLEVLDKEDASELELVEGRRAAAAAAAAGEVASAAAAASGGPVVAAGNWEAEEQ